MHLRRPVSVAALGDWPAVASSTFQKLICVALVATLVIIGIVFSLQRLTHLQGKPFTELNGEVLMPSNERDSVPDLSSRSFERPCKADGDTRRENERQITSRHHVEVDAHVVLDTVPNPSDMAGVGVHDEAVRTDVDRTGPERREVTEVRGVVAAHSSVRGGRQQREDPLIRSLEECDSETLDCVDRRTTCVQPTDSPPAVGHDRSALARWSDLVHARASHHASMSDQR